MPSDPCGLAPPGPACALRRRPRRCFSGQSQAGLTQASPPPEPLGVSHPRRQVIEANSPRRNLNLPGDRIAVESYVPSRDKTRRRSSRRHSEHLPARAILRPRVDSQGRAAEDAAGSSLSVQRFPVWVGMLPHTGVHLAPNPHSQNGGPMGDGSKRTPSLSGGACNNPKYNLWCPWSFWIWYEFVFTRISILSTVHYKLHESRACLL